MTMRLLAGLAGAGVIFAVSFALHIVGGATNQGWLFAIAVGLIYVSASGFGVVAWILAGSQAGERLTLGIGSVIGVGLTASALWAANDRSLAWWQAPAAVVLTGITSAILYWTWQTLRRSARERRRVVRPAG